MTYSILLIVKKPIGQDYDAKRDKYNGCKHLFESLTKENKDNRLLAENVILLPINKELNDVRDVLDSIDALEYTYAILTEDIKFHEIPTKI